MFQGTREGEVESHFVAGGCRELRAGLVRGRLFYGGDAGLDDEDSPRMSSSSRVVEMVAVWGGLVLGAGYGDGEKSR